MKNKPMFLFILIFTTSLNASVPDEVGYRFSLLVAAPPAEVQVVDETGNRLGADFTRPIDQFGRQGAQFDGLREIPNSNVEQENFSNQEGPNIGAPSTKTFWKLEIKNVVSKENLKIIFFGLGNALVPVPISFRKGTSVQSMKSIEPYIFTKSGNETELDIELDPNSEKMGATRVVAKGQLAGDVEAACARGDISPNVACSILDSLALEIDSNLDIKEKRESLKLFKRILERLNNFGKSGNLDWNDFDESSCEKLKKYKGDEKFFAKDPSYSILNEEADALLKLLPKDDDHDRNGDGR